MRILAYNAGHDGAAVLLEDSKLVFALEAEKDDGPRHAGVTPVLFVRSLQCDGPIDVVAISGWQKVWLGERRVAPAVAALAQVEAGYFDEGAAGKTASQMLLAGTEVRRFSSSHVRSHVMCGYGLSPFPQGQPCYVLLWEGYVGAMYYVDEKLGVAKLGDVMEAPGHKYQLSYVLADPSVAKLDRNWIRLEDAGKIMALAAYGRRVPPSYEQRDLIARLLSLDVMSTFSVGHPPKALLSDSRLHNIGVESQDYKDLALHLSNAIFDRFYSFAKEHVREKLPLLIIGGCGLNCEWNSRWLDSGLFADVFVPPCTNDSGVALGAAIDALHHYTGQAKVQWSVYAGDEFVEDIPESPDFVSGPVDVPEVCRRLARGEVIAWVQGKYEMGPRALGNRSLLAEPFSERTRDRLNRIKQREAFRPVAPICLEEDFGRHFEGTCPSPFMLHFQRVRSARLGAITHVDGSARAQSVNARDNPEICALLREFREQTGVGVLCNTSLNFKGRGFINRLSQLHVYAKNHGVDAFVVGRKFWVRREHG